MTEPTITINGHLLSEGEAMTVRVAVESFLLDLGDPDALGPDRRGREMTAAYKTRCRDIMRRMLSQPEPCLSDPEERERRWRVSR